VRFCATNIRNSSRVLLEIAIVFVRFDHIASRIVNANWHHGDRLQYTSSKG